MAANGLDARKRVVSKSFHRILDTYGRQTFTGARARVRCSARMCVCVCVCVCVEGGDAC
jgi:hypothetical protein